MSRKAWPLLVFVLLTLTSRSAAAAPILYSFTGTISSSSIAGIAVGDPIVGTFLYDPDAPLLIVLPSSLRFSPAVAVINATVGGSALASTVLDEDIVNDGSPSIPGVPAGVYDIFNLNSNPLTLALLDADATFFDSFSGLPPVLPLGEFELAVLVVLPPGGGLAVGFVDVVPGAVPEPWSLLLLGVGTAAATFRAKRRLVCQD